MKRKARLALLVRDQPALDQCAYSLKQKDLSAKSIHSCLDDLRLLNVNLYHRFGCCMTEVTPLHWLAQILGSDLLNTTVLYVRGTRQTWRQDVEKIAWT